MSLFALNEPFHAVLTAKLYKERGWSVIPLLGSTDSSRAKLPAIKWGRYQHTHPTDLEIEDWFLHQGYSGLGIVLGAVSGLVVLDFDDPAKVSEFRHLYPHLADTYTVESGLRRLPHYYYALPPDLNAVSRHVPGIDFRSDGTYVVAPPTAVDGAEWRLVRDTQPRVLTAADLRAIYRFMAASTPDRAQNGLEPPSRAIPALSDTPSDVDFEQNSDAAQNRRNSDTSFDPVRLYQARVSGGRNNALFDAALVARDRGWSEEAVQQALAVVHALQPDPHNCQESYAARYAEALNTISSAFSRPARSIGKPALVSETVGIPTPDSGKSLPGRLREWLLQHGMVAAARVLDGLLMSGIRAGGSFTERQACLLLSAYRIGRRAVMAALKSMLPDGSRLFQSGRNSPRTPGMTADAAIPAVGDETTKCDLVTGANRVKTPGRPPRSYQMPDISALTESLGVGIPTPSGEGALTPADLSSPAAYRRGLHRELLSRRPGQYPRRWLAERLGVSKWTCRRYEAQLSVRVEPVYSTHPVTWTNLESLLPPTLAEAHPGTFLEADGKRYPPLRAIAIGLLSTRRRVFYRQQGANHYHLPATCSTSVPASAGVGIPTPIPMPQPAVSEISHSLVPLSASPPALPDPNRSQGGVKGSPQSRIETTPETPSDPRSMWVCSGCMKSHIQTHGPEACTRCGSTQWEQWPSFIWRDPHRLKLWWQRLWRDTHPNAPRRATPLVGRNRCRNSDTSASAISPTAEATAERARQQVSGLSRRTARQLVAQYSAAAVDRAVAVVTRRAHVANPAGLLRTILRSEHLFYKPKESSATRDLESSQAWVEAMRDSDYADFIVNANDLAPVR